MGAAFLQMRRIRQLGGQIAIVGLLVHASDLKQSDVVEQSDDGRFEARGVLSHGSTHRVQVFESGRQLTWDDVLNLWESDASFAQFYSSVLAASPFKSFFWECPPVTNQEITKQPFEHVT